MWVVEYYAHKNVTLDVTLADIAAYRMAGLPSHSLTSFQSSIIKNIKCAGIPSITKANFSYQGLGRHKRQN